jgi:nucleotide-binding universal stress UspA family protein
MALKDVLVYVDRTANSLVSLRLAVDLAARHRSHLTALYIKELSDDQLAGRKAAELGLVSARGMQNFERRAEATMQAWADRLHSMLDELTRGRSVEAELQAIDGEAASMVPQWARYADLCILGRDEAEGAASINYTFSEQMLFVTGRPLLFVPPIESLTTLGRHIVVAWNSSRPATRSLNDALPLIERAERTTILMVNPAGFIGTHHAPPGERMVEHLKRHGVTADTVEIDDVPSRAIAETLQAQALALGADLVVAGAFGHPRLWEKILGGVTYDLMAGMRLPIFMSH